MDQHESSEEGLGLPLSPEHPMILGGQSLGSSLHPRLAWMMYYEETKNVQAVSEKFGISRKTFYKWYKRYKDSSGSTDSLQDRSRRPHRSPRATPESSIRLLMAVKEETGYGQRRLRTYLEQKYQVRLSERTIWKILKNNSPDAGEAKA